MEAETLVAGQLVRAGQGTGVENRRRGRRLLETNLGRGRLEGIVGRFAVFRRREDNRADDSQGWFLEIVGPGISPMSIQLTSRFLSLIVHDLRTPLNVMTLTLRLIDQAAPQDATQLSEDLRVVHENVGQIERMLAYLTDYCRLVDDPPALSAIPFDPRRLVSELVEEQASRSDGKAQVRLEVRSGCPREVTLDQVRARLAVQHALNNALAAADGAAVTAALDGRPGRLLVEVTIDRPPPATVHPIQLRSDLYERIFGVAQERRGLDLAIAARVSELFGGTARLEIVDARGSRITFDWPDRLPAA